MTKCRTARLVPTLAFLPFLAMPAAAQQMQGAAHATPFVEAAASGLTWSPAQPPGFDAGMELAVVSGDPSKAGQPYVLRLRFKDGYRFPAHFHPVAENLTVLDGEFLLAMGEAPEEAQLKTYRPGDYLFIESNHPHFGGAKGVTTIQLHGTGPFEIIVVGSAEDKR